MTDILKLEIPDNPAMARTIGLYFERILTDMWTQPEFDSKRPFGEGAWRQPVTIALIREGLVPGKLDEDGFVESVDQRELNRLVLKHLVRLFKPYW